MSKVVMMKPVVAIALASLLSACVGSNAPEPVKRPADPNANIAVRAGYKSPVQGDAGRSGYDSMVDAGLAAGMAQDFGAAGLGLGVVGWLAGGEYNLWKNTRLLTEVSPSTDVAGLERRIAEAALRVSGESPAKNGYVRVDDPKAPNAAVFIKPGCERNRDGYYTATCAKYYMTILTSTDDPSVKSMNIDYPKGNIPHDVFITMLAAALPRDLTLYVPPRIEGKTYVPPQLVKGGKATSF